MILHPKSKVKKNAKHTPTKGKCQVLRWTLVQCGTLTKPFFFHVIGNYALTFDYFTI